MSPFYDYSASDERNNLKKYQGQLCRSIKSKYKTLLKIKPARQGRWLLISDF